jgi:hypothetical protein
MSGTSSTTSLLDFLGAPIVVGDPEGSVIYVNPAFERAFSKPADEACGESLAVLFEGGGREAILTAVAEVCSRGETVNFRLREAGAAFLGLASPIEVAEDRVGVVILLTDEPAVDQRLMAFQAEITEPLDETAQALDELLEQTGGRRAERYRTLVERGASALARARKWNEELHGAIVGRVDSVGLSASLDPVNVVRQVAVRMADELAVRGLELELLAPAQLRAAVGDPAMLETALTRLIRHRAAASGGEGFITLSVRDVAGEGAGLLFSVVDYPQLAESSEVAGEVEPEPPVVRATVSALGGRIHTVEEATVGRVTSIQLAPAP